MVDLTTITDDDNRTLLERLRRGGLDVLIRPVPSDTDVAVFSAVLTPGRDWRAGPYAAFSGFGAHLDPVVAVARAVTEAAQSRLTLIHGGRDDLWPSEYARVLDHRAARAWARQMASSEPDTDFAHFIDRSSDSFAHDLETVLGALRRVVDEVAVVDLTRDDLGIPVVKVVIPGLAGIPFDDRPRGGGRGEQPVVPRRRGPPDDPGCHVLRGDGAVVLTDRMEAGRPPHPRPAPRRLRNRYGLRRLPRVR